MINLSKSKILVVEDNETNIDLLVELLGDDYIVSVALNGEKALDIVNKNPPDLILLDIMMPGMDGYEVCRRIKSNEKTKYIPIIFLTAMNQDDDELKGLDLGAVDYIKKPFNPKIVKHRVQNNLELKKYRDSLEQLVNEKTSELALTQDVTIESMGTLAEYRDPETGGHIKRTRNYVLILAKYLSKKPKYKKLLDDETIELLYKSAPLHDIGKVGVEDKILLKKGSLTHEEFEKMKLHTIYGRNAIKNSEKKLGENSFLRLAKEIAYTHHEKWDGSGYPRGLKGEDIPISGRIMAVADVYDALISKRVYKPPFTHEKAKTILIDGKGNHFDPGIIDAFLELEEEFRQIAIKYADFEEERINLLKK